MDTATTRWETPRLAAVGTSSALTFDELESGVPPSYDLHSRSLLATILRDELERGRVEQLGSGR